MNISEQAHAGAIPAWVPDCARIYLTHVGEGRAIRSIARTEGVQPSTVLRTVRRMESRRDDPLVDEALGGLTQILEDKTMAKHSDIKGATSEGELRRVLRRLAESGAVLALADGMERAIVVREGTDEPTRLAVTTRDAAREMALREWITAFDCGGRIQRYHLSSIGRSALKRMLSEDADDAYGDQHRTLAESADPEDPTRTVLRNLSESPLAVLGRRRDKDGHPFLGPELVAAGERLREDFELAQMGPRVAQNWDRFLMGRESGGVGPADPTRGAEGPRMRVAAALRELGPGLGDVVLRVCCFLEGIEGVEKRLGWSARSGKIVLRIALERLRRHYDSLGDRAAMIG